MKKIAALVVSIVLAAGLIALIFSYVPAKAASASAEETQAPAGQDEPMTVVASATAKAVTAPDMASISVGVTTENADPGTAQSENIEKMNAVIAALKELGVEVKSMRTSSYNMYPQYDYSSNQPKIVGYSVNTNLEVSDLHLDQVGTLISTCVSAGATDVGSVNYFCSDYTAVYEEALQKAVAAARVKAGVIAAADGKELDEVINITEGYQDMSASYSRRDMSAAKEEYAASDSVSIMPGETEIEARVTVTFSMK